MPGQPQLICPIPGGTVLGTDMYELNVFDPSLNPSNLIIDVGSAFTVSATFRIGGTLAVFIQSLAQPFTVTYYYEGFGGAADGALGNVAGTSASGVVSLTCAGALEYGAPSTNLVVPPATLLPGLYKLGATVTFAAPFPLMGFVEGPIVRQLAP